MPFATPDRQRLRPSLGHAVLAAVAVVLGWRPQRDGFYEADHVPAVDTAEEGGARPNQDVVARCLTNLALQDWVMLFFLSALLAGVLAGEGEHRRASLALLAGDFAIVGSILLLVRGGVLATTSRMGALLYRLAIFVAMLGSFFQLHYILPTITSRVVDADIYAFDLRVFGFEPALAWDRYVTRGTTEWFAFFYYGYFFVLALHILPIAFVARDRQILSEACLGIVVLFTIGHLLYIAVPGYGPYAYLAEQFRHELRGGLWWPLVRQAVDSAGARKDIFPSLHTAAPTFLALLSVRHRKRMPFRITWPLAIAFASQIVIATMFLRWHYLVDVCAGLALAGLSLLIAARGARWEKASRERRGLPPVWTPPLYLGAWSTRGPAD